MEGAFDAVFEVVFGQCNVGLDPWTQFLHLTIFVRVRFLYTALSMASKQGPRLHCTS